MSPDMQTSLKIIVERAVRPVRATLARKMQMREELLGHVREVFDEELQRQPENEAAAVEATQRRFGNPQEIAAGLQNTLPVVERYWLWIEQRFAVRPGESVLRRSIRRGTLIALFMAAFFAAALLPQVAFSRDPSILPIVLRVVGAAAAGTFLMTVALLLLGHWLRRAAFDRAVNRSPLRIFAVCVGAALLPIVTLGTMAFITSGGGSEWVGFLRWQFTQGPLVATALLFPLGLATGVWATTTEQRTIREWTDLEIE